MKKEDVYIPDGGVHYSGDLQHGKWSEEAKERVRQARRAKRKVSEMFGDLYAKSSKTGKKYRRVLGKNGKVAVKKIKRSANNYANKTIYKGKISSAKSNLKRVKGVAKTRNGYAGAALWKGGKKSTDKKVVNAYMKQYKDNMKRVGKAESKLNKVASKNKSFKRLTKDGSKYASKVLDKKLKSASKSVNKAIKKTSKKVDKVVNADKYVKRAEQKAIKAKQQKAKREQTKRIKNQKAKIARTTQKIANSKASDPIETTKNRIKNDVSKEIKKRTKPIRDAKKKIDKTVDAAKKLKKNIEYNNPIAQSKRAKKTTKQLQKTAKTQERRLNEELKKASSKLSKKGSSKLSKKERESIARKNDPLYDTKKKINSVKKSITNIGKKKDVNTDYKSIRKSLNSTKMSKKDKDKLAKTVVAENKKYDKKKKSLKQSDVIIPGKTGNSDVLLHKHK